MNAKEAIAEIKSLLFNEDNKTQKFALVEGKLEDGTVVKYDLETADIFVVGEDGKDLPAPVGEHKLETGEILVVETEGKIKEVKEVETPEEEADPLDMAKEDAPKEEETPKEEDTKMADDLQTLTDKVAALEQVVEEMKKAHEEMKKAQENMTEAVKLSADVIESLAKEPSAEPISKPNTFRSELKTDKENRAKNLQSVFQKLKNK
jgi:hypothetical protein